MDGLPAHSQPGKVCERLGQNTDGLEKKQSKVDLRRVKENGGIKATLDPNRGSQATTVGCSQGSGCVWELLGNVESK